MWNFLQLGTQTICGYSDLAMKKPTEAAGLRPWNVTVANLNLSLSSNKAHGYHRGIIWKLTTAIISFITMTLTLTSSLLCLQAQTQRVWSAMLVAVSQTNAQYTVCRLTPKLPKNKQFKFSNISKEQTCKLREKPLSALSKTHPNTITKENKRCKKSSNNNL